MSDKIAKLLAKLSPKQLQVLVEVLEKVEQGNLEGLDVKSLKGHPNTFRIRAGNYRIIFTADEQGNSTVLLIAKRDEQTYKGL